ncbi:MAG: hypothetical protein H6739_41780 [Alphaproteobacteria bacterium]|nr:hypothetical protein [Alphaproteobacteria bacterium]
MTPPDLWTLLVDGPALDGPAPVAMALVPLGWLWLGYLRRRGVDGGILWWLPAGVAASGVAVALLAPPLMELTALLSLCCGGIEGDQWAYISLFAHHQQALLLGVVAALLAPVALGSRRGDRALGLLWALVAALGAGTFLMAASRVELLSRRWGRGPPSSAAVLDRLEAATAALELLVPMLVVGGIAALGASLVALWRAPATPRGRWERRIGLALLVGALVGQGATTAWGVTADTFSVRPELDDAVAAAALPIADDGYGYGVLVGHGRVLGADGAALAPPRWRLAGLLLSPPLFRYVRGADEAVTLRAADTPVASLLDKAAFKVVTLPPEASTAPSARRAAMARVHDLTIEQTVEGLEKNLALAGAAGYADGLILVEGAEARAAEVGGATVWFVLDPGWTLQELLDTCIALADRGARHMTLIRPALAPAARALLTEGV